MHGGYAHGKPLAAGVFQHIGGVLPGCARFRLLSVLLLVFSALRAVLFAAWGGFFRVWAGFFRGRRALGVSSFFVALLCSLVWCCGRSFVLFGFCRGGCCRLLGLAFFVRGLCARHPRGSWLASVGSGRCRVSCLCRCLGRSRSLRLVGWLVGCCPGGWLLGCVGAAWWCCRAWRPAFFVFLVFFNICRRGRSVAASGAQEKAFLNGGKC